MDWSRPVNGFGVPRVGWVGLWIARVMSEGWVGVVGVLGRVRYRARNGLIEQSK